ncbi:FecR domain-containing protein [uncultured Draconibacterium sp.]|uniref:FecR family protein n=1 Tax=uncultured Draconibacterium sp. TaxID=1573823 RepID=UPI0029C94D39|nr:FecR domain-containing protein [uncultured Draconibacterium sp.]
MDDIIKFLENPKFVQWVNKPSKKLDRYWNDYIENHESEKEQITLARTYILSLQSEPLLTTKETSKQIYFAIERKIEKLEIRNKRKSFILTFSKFAAIGLIFFVLGIGVTQYIKSPHLDVFEHFGKNDNNYPYSTLTLSDGKNVRIPDKESEIVYNNQGQIVINKRDTVQSGEAILENDLNQLFVPYGKSASIKLPDGTVAHLNAGSSLIYPSKFEGSTRVVSLLGEGYFDVVHNPDMPFIVQTKEISVEVLGTKFDVAAYPGDNIVETVLVEGKVKMIKHGFQFSSKEYILSPNQRAAFDINSKETTISEVDVNNYISWQKGFLLFETQDLNRIFRKVERYYNINIRYADPNLGLLRISGKLELREDKESVLNVLAKTASVEIVKLNETEYAIK